MCDSRTWNVLPFCNQRLTTNKQEVILLAAVDKGTALEAATCRWGSGMPGQPFHYTGTDFLDEQDGCVSRLYAFIDQQLFQIKYHEED